MKSIKERAAQGLDSYGLNIGMSDPVVIEMAAKAGYDFVRLDFEHMLFDYGSAANMIRTARLRAAGSWRLWIDGAAYQQQGDCRSRGFGDEIWPSGRPGNERCCACFGVWRDEAE